MTFKVPETIPMPIITTFDKSKIKPKPMMDHIEIFNRKEALIKDFIESLKNDPKFEDLKNMLTEQRQDKAFNNAFKDFTSRLTPEQQQEFKENPVAFLKAHPELKPKMEDVAPTSAPQKPLTDLRNKEVQE